MQGSLTGSRFVRTAFRLRDDAPEHIEHSLFVFACNGDNALRLAMLRHRQCEGAAAEIWAFRLFEQTVEDNADLVARLLNGLKRFFQRGDDPLMPLIQIGSNQMILGGKWR